MDIISNNDNDLLILTETDYKLMPWKNGKGTTASTGENMTILIKKMHG